MLRPEQQLQILVVQYLELIEKTTPGFLFFHTPNGGGRSKVEGGILKAMGVKSGVLDIQILFNGQPYFIEMKKPRVMLPSGKMSKSEEKPSDSQEAFMEKLDKQGIPWAVCRSLEDVQDALRRWKMIR